MARLTRCWEESDCRCAKTGQREFAHEDPIDVDRAGSRGCPM